MKKGMWEHLTKEKEKRERNRASIPKSNVLNNEVTFITHPEPHTQSPQNNPTLSSIRNFSYSVGVIHIKVLYFSFKENF